jgi:hypothetical protein
MQKTIILAILILFIGCKSKATGEYNEIIVLCSDEDKEFVYPVIETFFSESISTPQPENVFKLVWKAPWDLESYKNRHNIIVVSIDNPADNSGDRLYQRLVESTSDTQNIISKNDMFAHNQLFIGLHGQDIIELQTELISNREWLLNKINTTFYNNLSEYVFSKGINQDLSSEVVNQFDININLQEDFLILEQTDNMLWLGRGYPYRWLIFQKLSVPITDVKQAWFELENIFSQTIPMISFSEKLRKSSIELIDGRKSLLLRGIYDHQESDTGGPFFTYLIKDSDNSSIAVTGLVNFPGHEKIMLLKQLELIIKTIKF